MTLGSVVAYFFFQLLIPLMFSVAVGSFLWGTSLFFLAGGKDEDLADHGKHVMLYGFLALIVTVLTYMLLAFIRGGV